MTLRVAIRARMAEQGIPSVAALAVRAGVRPVTVQNVMDGRATQESARRVAEALKTTEAELWGLAEAIARTGGEES